MATAFNINLQCEDCTYADKFGRNCKINMMYPILLLMSGKINHCPDFKEKTIEQIEEQIEEKK